MGTCFLHDPPEKIANVEMLDHLRVIHPQEWGDGPQRWPDGRIVVYDTTLTPGDFSLPAPPPLSFPVVPKLRGCDWHEEGGHGFVWVCRRCQATLAR